MCYCSRIIVLFLFSVSFLLPSSNSQDLDLTRVRDLTTRRDRNLITLRCIDASNGDPQPNALIFVNDTILSTQPVMDGVLLSITRETEGDFNCRDSIVRRSNNLPLVALPDMSESTIQSETFEADFGGMATLECPIPPGAALSRYYVKWVNANDSSTVAEILRPGLQGTRNPFTLQRYSVNRKTFSLIINDVKLPDGDIVYRCIPGVEDYNSAVEYLYDEETVGVHQTLVVNRGPEITFLSNNQQLSTSESRSATIRCCVLSAPSYSSVTWVHKGNTVRDNNTKYAIRTHFRVNLDTSEGGYVYITNSTLVVLDLEVLDDGVVECVAEMDRNSRTMTNQSRTTVNVSDKTLMSYQIGLGVPIGAIVLIFLAILTIISCMFISSKSGNKEANKAKDKSTNILLEERKNNCTKRINDKDKACKKNLDDKDSGHDALIDEKERNHQIRLNDLKKSYTDVLKVLKLSENKESRLRIDEAIKIIEADGGDDDDEKLQEEVEVAQYCIDMIRFTTRRLPGNQLKDIERQLKMIDFS